MSKDLSNKNYFNYFSNEFVSQGLDIIQKCITTVKERLAINSQNFAIKVVTKDGIRVISKPSCSPVPH